MIRVNGLPLTNENLSRAINAVSQNPQLLQTYAASQPQINYSTGKSSLPDVTIDEQLKASNPSPVLPSNTPVIPATMQTPSTARQPTQGDVENAQDEFDPNDEFEIVPPDATPPFFPIVAPAVGAGAAMRTSRNVDAHGMDIEGKNGLPGLPAPTNANAPQLEAPPYNYNQIEAPDERLQIGQEGAKVLKDTDKYTAVKSKRTGAVFYIDKATGDVYNNAMTKKLNKSASEALLRTVRRAF